jgi:peptidoglycan-N-acetylglucosamine deacetylase
MGKCGATLGRVWYRGLRDVLALALSACFGAATAQTVAFTFDDGPHLRATPLLSPAARDQALLDALGRHRVKAALFVTLANGADRPEGLALALPLPHISNSILIV